MSRDLEHLLNANAAEPSRPVDPAEIARLARRRRRRRRGGTAIAGIAATAGLVTAVALPLSDSADDVTTPPAVEPGPTDVPSPVEEPDDDAVPYAADVDCPVTEPPTPGFTPPEGYPAEPSDQADAGPPGSGGHVWYGTADLWTVLPVQGDYGRQRKSVWWSTSFPGGARESRPEINVTWRRLDVDAAPVNNRGSGTNAHTAEDGWFMIAGIDPAGPGCWQVTAKYKGTELSYVYEIPEQAGEDRPESETAEPDPTANAEGQNDRDADVDPTDQALMDAFVVLATEPSAEMAADVPFAETVALGLGSELLVERSADELGNPDAWLIDKDHFRAYTGPFSALERVRRHVAGEADQELQPGTDTKVEVGDYQYCAGSPLPPAPDAVRDLRRVSVQAADESATSWLGLFYVDLYVDGDGLVHAVTLDLCEP